MENLWLSVSQHEQWQRNAAEHVWKCENIMALDSSPSQNKQYKPCKTEIHTHTHTHQWSYQR